MLRLFLSLPPLGYFVLAGLMVAFGMFANQAYNSHQDEKALALAAPIPELVNLGDFTPSDKGLVDEVHIAVQINTDYNYELTKGTGNDSSARRMWVLFDPSDNAEEKRVQAAVLLPKEKTEQFVEWIYANVEGPGTMGPVFAMNGTHRRSPLYSDVANDALDKEGLIRSAGFFFFEPYLEGREVALAPNESNVNSASQLTNVIALLLAALGGGKMWFRNMMQKRRTATANARMNDAIEAAQNANGRPQNSPF